LGIVAAVADVAAAVGGDVRDVLLHLCRFAELYICEALIAVGFGG
jgi:hypothetical protein